MWQVTTNFQRFNLQSTTSYGVIQKHRYPKLNNENLLVYLHLPWMTATSHHQTHRLGESAISPHQRTRSSSDPEQLANAQQTEKAFRWSRREHLVTSGATNIKRMLLNLPNFVQHTKYTNPPAMLEIKTLTTQNSSPGIRRIQKWQARGSRGAQD